MFTVEASDLPEGGHDRIPYGYLIVPPSVVWLLYVVPIPHRTRWLTQSYLKVVKLVYEDPDE